MSKTSLLQDLTKLANKLDEQGEYKIANVLDGILKSADDDAADSIISKSAARLSRKDYTEELIKHIKEMRFEHNMSLGEIAKALNMHKADVYIILKDDPRYEERKELLTPEQEEEMKDLFFNEEVNMSELANMYGVSGTAIKARVREDERYEEPEYFDPTPEQKKEILRLKFEQYKSATDIAEIFDTSKERILKVLREDERYNAGRSELTDQEGEEIKRLKFDVGLSVLEIARIMGSSRGVINKKLKGDPRYTHPIKAEMRLEPGQKKEIARLFFEDGVRDSRLLARMFDTTEGSVKRIVKKYKKYREGPGFIDELRTEMARTEPEPTSEEETSEQSDIPYYESASTWPGEIDGIDNKKSELLRDLTKLANKLDEQGHYKVASALDRIVKNAAAGDKGHEEAARKADEAVRALKLDPNDSQSEDMSINEWERAYRESMSGMLEGNEAPEHINYAWPLSDMGGQAEEKPKRSVRKREKEKIDKLAREIKSLLHSMTLANVNYPEKPTFRETSETTTEDREEYRRKKQEYFEIRGPIVERMHGEYELFKEYLISNLSGDTNS